MLTLPILLVLLAAWTLLFLVCLGEFTLREFSHSALERAAKSRNGWGKQRAASIFDRHEQVERALTECRMLLLAGLVLAIGLYGREWMVYVPGPSRLRAIWLAMALLMSLQLTTVWLPWAVARLWAEPLLLLTWPLWRAVEYVFLPFRHMAQVFDAILQRASGRSLQADDDEAFEDEILTIVAEGQHEGIIEEEAREMIEGVMELSDAPVSRIMTPRTDILMINEQATWVDITAVVIESGHSRLPVYGESRDDIVGIVHVKDLLPVILRLDPESPPALQQFLRPAVFVPETKNLHALLSDFQSQRQHMALVLDEYGGVSGLVTIEDVLEEIVGEIVDEHDEALEDNFRSIGSGLFEVQGREHVDDINERLGLSIPEGDDYETVAGFIFTKLGHVPTIGERIELSDCRITISDASRRAVHKVRIEVLSRTSEQQAG